MKDETATLGQSLPELVGRDDGTRGPVLTPEPDARARPPVKVTPSLPTNRGPYTNTSAYPALSSAFENAETRPESGQT